MKSIKGVSTIHCPHCDERIDVDFYSIIDADSEPELRDFVRSGELHLNFCEHCGTMFHHDTDFVYIDSSVGLFAFIFSKKSAENQLALKKKMAEDIAAFKENFAKELNINGEPVFLFGLEELKAILDEDTYLTAESEVVAAASVAAGFKIARLNPAYAKKNGYPLYVPVKDGQDFAVCAGEVLETGLNSARLKKFMEDVKNKGEKPEVL